MTYMGKPYYPLWLDNLADDATLEAAAMDGTARGADDVRFILVKAREQYEHQEFNYAGPCGESGFLEDFANMLKRLIPSDAYYAHDDWDRRTENICPEDMDFGNGHSHCMAMLLGTAGESIPVREGELCLGTWQRVLFLELDRERDRRWIVQVVGT